ncbi:MAG: competence protein ComEA, partial [Pseudomonadota bacterium]|nr:competence protein ComEA [Pseudomonadota bacterium]
MKFFHVILALTLALFSMVTFAEAININTATAEQLEKGLTGIGPSKAAAIVKYREANGPFTSVNDLTKVPGIKDKALEGLLADKRNQLTVGDAAMPATPAAPATPATPAAPATPATPAAP